MAMLPPGPVDAGRSRRDISLAATSLLGRGKTSHSYAVAAPSALLPEILMVPPPHIAPDAIALVLS